MSREAALRIIRLNSTDRWMRREGIIPAAPSMKVTQLNGGKAVSFATSGFWELWRQNERPICYTESKWQKRGSGWVICKTEAR